MDLGDRAPPGCGHGWGGPVARHQDVRNASDFVLLHAEHCLLLADRGQHFLRIRDISTWSYVVFVDIRTLCKCMSQESQIGKFYLFGRN